MKPSRFDPTEALRLLRPRRQQPRRSAAETNNELAPLSYQPPISMRQCYLSKTRRLEGVGAP